MIKELESLQDLSKLVFIYGGVQQYQIIEKSLKALEIIKKHILNRDIDTSGIYLEFHNEHYEPYYTIEIREGIKQIVSPEEYDLLKEVLL